VTSPSPPGPELEAAYRSARYRVDAPEGRFELEIGAPAPALDRLLAAARSHRWVYLTAVNPASIRLEEEENRRRLSRLDAEIARRGWPAYPGTAVDPRGSWPDEPSRLVLGPDEATARELARRFGQNAFVAGERGGAPRLCWVDEPPAGA